MTPSRRSPLGIATGLCALAGLFLAPAPGRGSAQEPKPAGARKTPGDTPPGKSYVYKQSAVQPREMEVYFPPDHDPARARVPGVILFHGGGWSGGSPSQFRTACHYLAGRGLVAATAAYRMLTPQEGKNLPPGETRKRACITDAKSAIRWFKQHASELGVDPQRVITGGGSAGGHISVLATVNPGLNDPGDPQDVSTSVAAYLLFNPAFAPEDSQDAEVDVLRHLKPDFAPAVVFFGTEDKWKRGWDAVHGKLRSLGAAAPDLQVAEGQSHGFFNRDPWQTVTLIAADRFLAQRGFLKGDPALAPPATGEKLRSAPFP